MNSFLGCTKTYETVVLFGKSTDTYDVAGKVVGSAPHSHLSKALVEEKLALFRGKIRQMPPIYSALNIDGMRAYEYARTEKKLPRELEARDLEVKQCEIVEWFEGGRHEYRWPAIEATSEVKQVANNLAPAAQDETQEVENLQKKTLSGSPHEESGVCQSSAEKQRAVARATTPQPNSNSVPTQEILKDENLLAESPKTSSTLIYEQPRTAQKARLHTHEVGPLSSEICPAPATRIRVTASSGFYVRSFAHDLGIACGSLALMATLFRSRQAEFDAESALTYQDLANGETTWRPKLHNMLRVWNEQHPEEPRVDGTAAKGVKRASGGQGSGVGQKTNIRKEKRTKLNPGRDRRNTSSGED